MLTTLYHLTIVTSYIQEASATPGPGIITLSCTTDPAVMCDAVVSCSDGRSESVNLASPAIFVTTQPCNITIVSSVGTQDQITFTSIVPLAIPTATTTMPGPTPSTPPSGE